MKRATEGDVPATEGDVPASKRVAPDPVAVPPKTCDHFVACPAAYEPDAADAGTSIRHARVKRCCTYLRGVLVFNGAATIHHRNLQPA
jgi:hypothetical protein